MPTLSRQARALRIVEQLAEPLCDPYEAVDPGDYYQDAERLLADFDARAVRDADDEERAALRAAGQLHKALRSGVKPNNFLDEAFRVLEGAGFLDPDVEWRMRDGKGHSLGIVVAPTAAWARCLALRAKRIQPSQDVRFEAQGPASDSLVTLGKLLARWGGGIEDGGDWIGAAGSYFLRGRAYPDVHVVILALHDAESLLRYARDHEPIAVPELERMRQGLKAYVDSHPTSPKFFRGRG